MPVLDIIPFVHNCLKNYIKVGNTVVDATMGNGYDTLFLSQLVGSSGKVFAFDIQPQALENTRQLLTIHNIKNVSLILDSHIHFRQYFSSASAFIYNLGYLPKGNKNITTKVENTLLSIQQAMPILLPKGILAVVVYPGHVSGLEEAQGLEYYLKHITQQEYEILRYQFINHSVHSPYAILIQKK